MEGYNKYSLCRLCLGSDETLVSIFVENNEHGYVAAEVIEDLLNLQVSQEDPYPRLICGKCLDKLTEFQQFKSQCHISIATYNNVYSAEEFYSAEDLIVKEEDPHSEGSVTDDVSVECNDEKLVTAEEIEQFNTSEGRMVTDDVSVECNDEKLVTAEEIEQFNTSEGRMVNEEEECQERDPLSDSHAVQGVPPPMKLVKMTYGKGVKLCKQSRQMIYALRDYFTSEKFNKRPLVDCNEVVERTAEALKISTACVGKIHEKMKKIPRDTARPTNDFLMYLNEGKGTRFSPNEGITLEDGKVLKNQAQEMVYSVINYFQMEKDNGGPLIDCQKVLDRTTAAFGIGKTTVLRICREMEESEAQTCKVGKSDVQPDSPGKNRLNSRNSLTRLDCFRKEAICSYVTDYYKQNEVPCLRNLLESLKKDDLFHGNEASLLRVLKSVGFKWGKLAVERRKGDWGTYS